jgi:hypothetical protein
MTDAVDGPGFLGRPWVPAGILLLGSASTLVGLAWDVQWHNEVGPDTFFTLPHLFIYAGAASSGLVSLAVVLVTTAAARSGRTVDTNVGGRPVAVFGVFQAPLGFLVSGTGSALFLLYGLWDEWWHGLYGFDAVIDSPPHVGLLTSVMLAMIGSIITCAAGRGQPWAGPALIASFAILLGFSMVVLVALPPMGLVDGRTATAALLSMMVLATAVSLTRGVRTAVYVAVALGLTQIVLALFSPLATRVYAEAENLPLRDYTAGLPRLSMLMPSTLLLGVAALGLVAAIRRQNHPRASLFYLVGGALGGAALAATHPWQSLLFGAQEFRVNGPAQIVATIVAGALLGAAGGAVGQRLGTALQLLVPASAVPASAVREVV